MREATFLKKSFPPRPPSKDFHNMAPPAHDERAGSNLKCVDTEPLSGMSISERNIGGNLLGVKELCHAPIKKTSYHARCAA